MRIESLNLDHFAGIDKAEIALGGPGVVNLFCGGNGCGKTTIGNAVEWLLTGITRDMARKSESKYLARNLGKGCKVAASIDGQRLSRTPSGCSMTEESLRMQFGEPLMLEALLTAWRIIELKPEKRRNLVRQITADPEAIKAEILKHADAEVLPANEVAEVLSRALVSLDRAEKYAVGEEGGSGRRAAGRELNAIAEPPPRTIEVGGKQWDLREADAAKMSALLASVKAERDAAIEKRGAAKILGSVKDIKAQIEEIERKLFAEPGSAKRENQLKKALSALEDDLEFARTASAKAQAWREAAAKKFDALGALDCEQACPTCQQAIDAKHIATIRGAVLKDGNAASEACRKAEEEAEKLAAEWKSTKDELAAETARCNAQTEGRRKLEQLKVDLAESEQFGDIEAEVETLTARVQTGQRLIDAKAAFDQGLAAQANREHLEALATAWDRLAKALGKDGPVRKVAAQGFSLEPVLASAAELLPGREVTVDDDWEIFVDRIPARMILSESERLRLGAAFAAALARASGRGFLVIDRLDCLEPALRPGFLSWLADQAEGLDTILAMATTTTPPAAQDWLRVWQLQGGRCEEIVTESDQ